MKIYPHPANSPPDFREISGFTAEEINCGDHWLRTDVECKIKENNTAMDLKCPICQTWSSIAGLEHVSGNQQQERYKCLQCFNTTAWEFHGPCAISVPIEYWPERKHG